MSVLDAGGGPGAAAGWAHAAAAPPPGAAGGVGQFLGILKSKSSKYPASSKAPKI